MKYLNVVDDEFHVLRQVEIRHFTDEWVTQDRQTACSIDLYGNVWD